MAVGDRRDPYRVYNFRVEIDGIDRGGFRECAGLDSTQEPTEYREGTDRAITVRKLPGLVKYSNISLKWGLSDDTDLWAWISSATEGSTERRNGSIVLMNDRGEETARWNFREGWPTSWKGADFNATSNEVAIETLEIAHEGLTRA